MFNYKIFPAEDKDLKTPEDCESLISSASTLTDSTPTASSRYIPQRSSLTHRICQVFILYLLLPTATLLLGIWIGRIAPEKTQDCISQVSKYSPLLEDFDITFTTKAFNGSLFKSNDFRAPAGPVVDAAWDSLGVDYRAAIVPTNLAQKSDLLPSQVQIASKYGGGYLANVEGLHHLHCLNLLRQSLYYNFDYYHSQKKGAFKNEDGVLQAHVTHCLDILRQQLQCTVDIGMLGQVWWNREGPSAFPDFNTRHTCRNFEAVRSWAERHQAPKDVPEDYLMWPRMEDVFEEIP